MRFVILNGSPKGNTGNTIQYVKFIQKHFPQHDYVWHNISSRIGSIESNADLFNTILSDIDAADSIIWATPVYTLFVPAQLMRFIELIHERDCSYQFKGKYAVVISTSIHFYDHTAHRYMNAVCDDLEMNYLGYFSAEMDDILDNAGRAGLKMFAENFIMSAEKGVTLPKHFHPLYPTNHVRFIPDRVSRKIDAGNKKIVIVTDAKKQDLNLIAMTDRFSASFSGNADLVNLWDIDIKGGCTGCIRCGHDNTCIYKDHYTEVYRSRVLPADIIVFAMKLINRNFSSRFKTFFDRRFFMNHIPELRGKQIVYLVSGSTGQLPYMDDFFQGSVEWQKGNLLGVVRDDSGDSDAINRNIQYLAETALMFSEAGYCSPRTFLGVGAAKIFRDDIWGKLRFVFRADYNFYKKNKLFDFPHRNYRSRMFNLVMRLLKTIPRFRREFYKRIRTEQSRPYEKTVARY